MTTSKGDIRGTVEADIKAIASNVRQQDIDELWASAHITPYEAMHRGLMVSRDTCFTYTVDEEPICIFGVKVPSMLSNVAVPWMIASDNIRFNSASFLRKSREVIKLLSVEFPFMENHVDARNKVAIRWLQWVGFSVYYPEPYGAEKLPFHRFDMRAEKCAV